MAQGKEMRDMSMFVCDACTVLHITGDYSGTGWDESKAEEVAENLKDYVIFIEDDPLFTMEHCSGCGQSGIDAYRARYYDEAN